MHLATLHEEPQSTTALPAEHVTAATATVHRWAGHGPDAHELLAMLGLAAAPPAKPRPLPGGTTPLVGKAGVREAADLIGRIRCHMTRADLIRKTGIPGASLSSLESSIPKRMAASRLERLRAVAEEVGA